MSLVAGVLVIESPPLPPEVGFVVELVFIRTVLGAPDVGPRFDPASVAGVAQVVTFQGPQFQVELPPGHYQTVARGGLCELREGRLAVGDVLFNEHPEAHTFSVRSGQHSIAMRVRVKPPGQDVNQGIGLVWATDGRMHGKPMRLHGELETAKVAELPAQVAAHLKQAHAHGNANRNAEAMAEYERALGAVPASHKPFVPTLWFDTQLGRAKCLVAMGRTKHACELLSSAYGESRALPVLPAHCASIGCWCSQKRSRSRQPSKRAAGAWCSRRRLRSTPTPTPSCVRCSRTACCGCNPSLERMETLRRFFRRST